MAALFAVALGTAGCGASNPPFKTGVNPPQDSAIVKWELPGGNPAGVVLMIPGGGFRRPAGANFQHQVEVGQAVAAGGYATAVIRYRTGAPGFKDIEKVYAQARKRYPSLPVCAYGGSAGGTWALLLAAREPKVACVVDLAGPTDLTSIGAQGSTDAQLLQEVFSRPQLKQLSPVTSAGQIKAKVLMVYAENDPIVPIAQGDELARALPDAEFIKLPAGSSTWIHSAVSGTALQSATSRQVAFLRDSLAAAGGS